MSDPRSRGGEGLARRLPAEPGSYFLLIRLRAARTIRAGALGRRRLVPGLYLYAGSARGPGGIRGRVGRHLAVGTKARKPHWHVDSLLAAPGARVLAAGWLVDGGKPAGGVEDPDGPAGGGECGIVDRALARLGARVSWPGFGSSDCRSGCPAHLLELGLTRCTRGSSTVCGSSRPLSP